MNADKKRKVRNIALLALLGLIGGTFAFTAFNQQAINDRERENLAQVGGRVHDYFNREEENKDVFVENFGQEPLMARLRLSEYMAIQERGQTEWTSVVSTSDREDTSTWSTYIPSANNLTERTGEGYEYFNQFSRLSFGREGAAPGFFLRLTLFMMRIMHSLTYQPLQAMHLIMQVEDTHIRAMGQIISGVKMTVSITAQAVIRELR